MGLELKKKYNKLKEIVSSKIRTRIEDKINSKNLFSSS